MSKIRWIKHITMSNTLLCPAIDSVKHITVSTLAFNTLIQPSPFYMLWSYHASLCLDLYYYKRGEDLYSCSTIITAADTKLMLFIYLTLILVILQHWL